MKRNKNITILCLIFFTFLLVQGNGQTLPPPSSSHTTDTTVEHQESLRYSTQELDFDIVKGKPLIKDTDPLVDSIPDEHGEDYEGDESFENIPYRGPSIHYIYFEDMPGYGTYQNFDVMFVHYKHEGLVKADTLVLTNYHHPAPFKATSNYGIRHRRMHYGVDLGYPVGTPVVAAFDGEVRVSQVNAGGYGNIVVIRHYNGLETYYGHLSQRLVNPGQKVQAGDTIGLGGNTGRSFGSHLHFETRYLGTPFNPRKIIDFDNMKLVCDTLYIKGNSPVPYLLAEMNKKQSKENNNLTTPSSSSVAYYTVKDGDTLSHIAFNYGTSVQKLMKINGMSSDFLRSGQRLRVR
ncbi:MAG: peptidoglycan DD-metalloendopeptidase family protein [Bacteroidales bacterium]|jgi:murein DD-endopeptidase MepM/ murein hydrolase activator NlpD|nr:peptidoglycan DD-metalloendopeptidase family protein [Bacteroidales bacterium]